MNCLFRVSHLHSLLGILVQGSPLGLKDSHVGFEKVLSLHALLPGHGAHEDCSIQVLEAHLHLIRWNYLCRNTAIRPFLVLNKNVLSISQTSNFTFFLGVKNMQVLFMVIDDH